MREVRIKFRDFTDTYWQQWPISLEKLTEIHTHCNLLSKIRIPRLKKGYRTKTRDIYVIMTEVCSEIPDQKPNTAYKVEDTDKNGILVLGYKEFTLDEVKELIK